MSVAAEDVLRYRDARFQVQAAKLLPTQYLVVDDGTALVTVLGSCVAACLRDPLLGIGGMNHFMLPDGSADDGAPARYGSHAMELLINDLLKRGANRRRLEAKVFGGANVLRGFTSNPVGTRNADFVATYLGAERIPVIASDLRGIHPRKVWFFPDTGRVMVQRLPHAHEAEVAATETAVRARLSGTPTSGGVELFE
ncbi:chemoreceptor glutamine deamidase CheD [Luteimonas yindakuii]|uniref:Probable chemoreceptor glutamine deamidase CheD n=1 Tax=Luteimonas yindakuii TaxID=2565782 RepID=A0A4Z1R374_9GAMM|nr:chemoreceptor glutamine deamidase CheD [Luteimonas yindakuii]QCO67661.1 chemoreceptor glutamine deamidase CheD [Luteimonas yindakuii]TKS53940.1 chemoreceptor glutamine deamidase CheD [Luteimonas yindakuii]